MSGARRVTDAPKGPPIRDSSYERLRRVEQYCEDQLAECRRTDELVARDGGVTGDSGRVEALCEVLRVIREGAP